MDVSPGLRMAVEVDARMTEDGELVAFHDVDLARVLGVRRCVRAETAAALSRLSEERRGVGVPTLDAALEASGALEVVIDAHDADRSFVEAFVRWLARLEPVAKERLTVASEHARVVHAVRSRCPGVRTAATALEIVLGCALASLGLGARLPRERAWMVPEAHRGIRIATREFARAAAAGGDCFWVWVVDDANAAARLRAQGATGVFTTAPGTLCEALARRAPSK